jgi:hypothetical protein
MTKITISLDYADAVTLQSLARISADDCANRSALYRDDPRAVQILAQTERSYRRSAEALQAATRHAPKKEAGA